MNALRKLFATCISVFPFQHRFKATVVASYILRPVFPVITVLQKDKRELYVREGGPTSLNRCLRTLILFNVTFKPIFSLNKAEIVKLCEGESGVLITSIHNQFNCLVFSYLQDLGHNPIIIAIKKENRLVDRTVLNSIQPSSSFLLKMRAHLRQGQIVTGMVDLLGPIPGRTTEIETCYGKIHISDALFRVAANCNSKVVFVKYKVKANKIAFEIGHPSANNVSHSAITSDFIDFLQAC